VPQSNLSYFLLAANAIKLFFLIFTVTNRNKLEVLCLDGTQPSGVPLGALKLIFVVKGRSIPVDWGTLEC
jgi:uncharacterized integral membrane protein